MDGTELARWTRFAAKGGIGKCTALQDCVAESEEDLMFLKVSILFFCFWGKKMYLLCAVVVFPSMRNSYGRDEV